MVADVDSGEPSTGADPTALVAAFETVSSLLVVGHDSPDPDCLASALALRTIAESAGVETVDIVYGGHISHQQNRAFVNLLALDLDRFDPAQLDTVDSVAFVDHAVPGINNSVPTGTNVDVVIDHHEYETSVDADYLDLRTGYAATVTILLEYLDGLDLEPTPELAAAALFALHRETIDFVRGPTMREYEVAARLLDLVDEELIKRMYGAMFTPETLDAIGEAIRTREIRGSALVSSVGRVSERDALPQAADLLLNLEGVTTVLVFGLVGDHVQLSARSVDSRIDVGELLRQTFADVGTAGGHDNMAGGQLPLGLFADESADDFELVAFVGDRIGSRFFDAMNLSDPS
ncbi:DHH family protein [Halogranum amylolyticum]|uniref:DHH family protein n=1 Tax=Halogranum amylolyticum TaxID=660520 RepID=A0A1H8W067_9EURY|nr:bifunctional oligoribonuclease/PAP phosphatase NrnA [Halogranum amylolyticum]SEP21026.1 DHH family protein [Halogranum amylolyticum]